MTNSGKNSSFFFALNLVFKTRIQYTIIKWSLSGGLWCLVVSGVHFFPNSEAPLIPKAGEAMLIGEFSHSIDEKGRVRIPKNFREDLGETFYITKGFEKCLFVFHEVEWKNFMEKLRANNFKDSKNRRIQRFFTGSAIEANLDGQGRITLSQALRSYAGLEKDVAVIGMDNRVEIRSADNWNEYI